MVPTTERRPVIPDLLGAPQRPSASGAVNTPARSPAAGLHVHGLYSLSGHPPERGHRCVPERSPTSAWTLVWAGPIRRLHGREQTDPVSGREGHRRRGVSSFPGPLRMSSDPRRLRSASSQLSHLHTGVRQRVPCLNPKALPAGTDHGSPHL